MFNDELNNVKKELSSKLTNMMSHQPKYAGAAHWARALKRRIDRPMQVCANIFRALLLVIYGNFNSGHIYTIKKYVDDEKLLF